MRRSLIAAAAFLAATAQASAHAIFPGQVKVQTLGERAMVQLRAVNARKDVSNFVVEIYDADSWIPARNAVAWPNRLHVEASDQEATESRDQPFSVLVDLQGKPEQRLRVCTKSVPSWDQLRTRTTIVNSRVCANVLVQRFQR